MVASQGGRTGPLKQLAKKICSDGGGSSAVEAKAGGSCSPIAKVGSEGLFGGAAVGGQVPRAGGIATIIAHKVQEVVEEEEDVDSDDSSRLVMVQMTVVVVGMRRRFTRVLLLLLWILHLK